MGRKTSRILRVSDLDGLLPLARPVERHGSHLDVGIIVERAEIRDQLVAVLVGSWLAYWPVAALRFRAWMRRSSSTRENCWYAFTTSRLDPRSTMRPRSIQIASSQNIVMCSSEWETSKSEAPLSTSSRMRSPAFDEKYASPALSISSTIRISGSIAVAVAKDRRACIPAEYVRNGCVTKSPSSVNSAISAIRSGIRAGASPEAECGSDVLLARELGMEARRRPR